MSGIDDTRPHPALPSFARGQTVGGGRFVLMRPLGRGPMGVVWLAEDEQLHQSVALKFLPRVIYKGTHSPEDFWDEIARVQKLTHPHIVRIHALYEESPALAFIAMEYVDGSTLSAVRLQEPNRILNWEFLEPLVFQLGDALEYAHAEKILHRNLKPSNLLVDQEGKLKLADFGTAAPIAELTNRSSLSYLSPQQINDGEPQPADDIYALGAILYELLTSKPPFHTGDILHQVAHVPPPRLVERLAELRLTNNVPPHISALIESCLNKEATQRPQSARAVVERLRGVTHDTRVIARSNKNGALPRAGIFFNSWFSRVRRWF